MAEPSLRLAMIRPSACLPQRATPGSAGLDLCSAVDTVVGAGAWATIPTGLVIAAPEGCYARVAPRSGLAVRHGICVGAGVVDADYRGEVGVVLFNHGAEPFAVRAGDRIAQLVLERIVMAEPQVVVDVAELSATRRGGAGFGSSGAR